MAEITYNIKGSPEGGIIIVLLNTGWLLAPCGSLKIEDAEQNLIWEHVFEAPYFQTGQTMTIKIPISAFPSTTGAALKTLTITLSYPWPGDPNATITLNIPNFDSLNSINNLISGAWLQFTVDSIDLQ